MSASSDAWKFRVEDDDPFEALTAEEIRRVRAEDEK